MSIERPAPSVTHPVGTGEILLEARNIKKIYEAEGKQPRGVRPPVVLEDITVRIASGEFVALLGTVWFWQIDALAHCSGPLAPNGGTGPVQRDAAIWTQPPPFDCLPVLRVVPLAHCVAERRTGPASSGTDQDAAPQKGSSGN